MNYPDSVQYLYSLGNEMRSARLGLERIRTLMEELGNPQDQFSYVHVAGTNGKGSTCAMIESGLRVAGRRTGLFTSPHLTEPTERVRINGVEVSREAFTRAFGQVHAAAERLLERGAIDMHPSYFECITAMAFLLFTWQRVEWVVMEVGLGGRLDATNIIQPRISVITQIDYDHQEWLGHTLEAIAREKAGILRPGVPAVFEAQSDEAARVLDSHRPALRTSEWSIEYLVLQERGTHLAARRGDRRIKLRCPLPGEHQVENALAAASVLLELGVEEPSVTSGIAQTVWPGRLERVPGNPEIILDGAHNLAGTRALASYIDRFYSNRKVTLIYGAMGDKDVSQMAQVLFPLAQRVVLTRPDNPRAIAPEAMAKLVEHPDLVLTATVAEALERIQPGQDEVVFVSGSLYLVGQARAILLKRAV